MPQFQKLRELLETSYAWPAIYTFKFIIHKERELEFIQIMGLEVIEYKVRASGQGKYLAFTFSMSFDSSEKVIEVYRKGSKIPGVIAL